MMKRMMVLVLLGALASAHADVRRVNNVSPVFRVTEDDVDFFMNYTGFMPDNSPDGGRRMHKENIGPKVLDMIRKAERHIIMSVFLFDSFYSEGVPEKDVVTVLRDAFLEQRRKHPRIHIAIILDPSHKAYGRRESEATRMFRENGIDVFYSDLVGGLKKASLVGVREGLGHAGRVMDAVTFRGWGKMWSGLSSKAKLPKDFDGDAVTLETAYNAFLMKANHRKILVTDTGPETYEMFITSANPHNASAFHVNSAVSVKGAAARYTYNLLREDMRTSARLGSRYAHWHYDADRAYRKRYFTENFPALDVDLPGSAKTAAVGVTVVTEEEIPRAVLHMLKAVEDGDEVRIQMFYLSFKPVVDAILDASLRAPVLLLLDANKDSFNMEKDGTPNRQVARYLLKKAKKKKGRLAVRWYSTHGEQNHAKVMSITNRKTGKYLLTTGSCNWTGRNMDGVNMEANVVVEGSEKVVAAFNAYFDAFWSNKGAVEYSLPYELFKDQTAADISTTIQPTKLVV